MDIELFKQRLIETATWCQGYSKAEHRLRSPVLLPNSPNHGDTSRYETWPHRAEIIEDVIDRRASLLQKGGVQTINLSADLQGRLLIYSPEQTLTDCTAEMETDGFYDSDDTPPWDTWFWYEKAQRGSLIAWIPPQYKDVAEHGAQFPYADALQWLDEMDTPFTHQLRAAGLLF